MAVRKGKVAKKSAKSKRASGVKRRGKGTAKARRSAKRSAGAGPEKASSAGKPKKAVKKAATAKRGAVKPKAARVKVKPKANVKPKVKAKPRIKPKAATKSRPKTAARARPANSAPKPGRVKITAKSAASAALLKAAATARLQRPLPKPVLPDLADLESIVAHASKDSSERLVSEATKFDIGIAHNGMSLPQTELPSEYGNDRVMLLVVDPSFVFTYWEVTNDSLKRALETVGPSGRLTLRFYDMSRTDSTHKSHHWDVEIFDRMGNWYLRLAHPEQRLCLDIGMKNAYGQFHSISRSNVMRLPPQGLAKPGPIKWMVVTPSGEKLSSDVEEYTDADLDLLKSILGPYFYDLLMRGKLASITGSSMEAIFYDVSNLSQPPGQSPTGASWSQAR